MKAIITVLGNDKVGIVAAISSVLAENGCNIEDISQTIMDKIFSMVMLVTIDEKRISFDNLKDTLAKTGEQLELQISLQQENVFNFMHRI